MDEIKRDNEFVGGIKESCGEPYQKKKRRKVSDTTQNSNWMQIKWDKVVLFEIKT